MSVGTRVIGIGQAAAGDDGVGIAVVRRLSKESLPRDVELLEVAEPSALIPLLRTPDPVILVDAIVGDGSPGEVIEIDADALPSLSGRPLSTHGVDVAQALALARTLYPDSVTKRIRIVGIRIARPERYVHALSPVVSEGASRAALAVRAHLDGA